MNLLCGIIYMTLISVWIQNELSFESHDWLHFWEYSCYNSLFFTRIIQSCHVFYRHFFIFILYLSVYVLCPLCTPVPSARARRKAPFSRHLKNTLSVPSPILCFQSQGKCWGRVMPEAMSVPVPLSPALWKDTLWATSPGRRPTSPIVTRLLTCEYNPSFPIPDGGRNCLRQ